MPNASSNQDNYDPRWFIWTIVFLLVTGISLVSYIMLSDTGTTDVGGLLNVHHTAKVQKQ